ncbi:MAG TPA: enoyl-CoA hydratase-related protein, partial [Isosphaeraceae bacterium]|nr:enoyl-CoA hydratase-related protein [Isosphaeraceae bacterium]
LGDLLDRVHSLPAPVVSALGGDAEGMGAGLALAADVVVMADSARMGFPDVKRGLVPALIVPDLVRQVGDRRARELLLTGRMVECEEALDWGLVNRVVACEHVLEESIAIAEGFCRCGPVALSTIKQLLDESTQRPRTLRGSAAVSAAVGDSDEAREGIDAYRESRRPRWGVEGKPSTSSAEES